MASRSNVNSETMKYPPSKSGQMPLDVKKSYSFTLRLMAHCSSESIKKKMNEFSAYLMTGIRMVIAPLLMTQLFFASSASLRYIESMRLALILLLSIGSVSFADETLFDNGGNYVNIEHQEGLDTDRVLIVSRNNVYIGDVDQNGYFNALGARAGTSAWGSQTGEGQVIVLRTPADETE